MTRSDATPGPAPARARPERSGRVGIVTDSAASIAPEVAAALGIVVVPMQISFGDRPIPGRAAELAPVGAPLGAAGDERGISLDEVLAHLAQGVHTAGPTPAAFLEAYERADRGSGVLAVTVASRLSSTFATARLAGTLRGDGSVDVLDSGTAAGAEGLVVTAAALAARSGASLEAVAARARAVARAVRLVAVVDSLDQLAKTGRIPDLAGRAGRRLGLRPLFELRAGRPRLLRPSLGERGATEAVLGQWRRSVPTPPGRLHVVALHALDELAATRLLEGVRAEHEPEEAFVGRFGPVMVAHTGPGVRGLAWWWETEDGKPLPISQRRTARTETELVVPAGRRRPPRRASG